MTRRSAEPGLTGLWAPAAAALVWEAAARAGVLDTRFFPPPTAVFAAGLRLLREDGLALDAAASLGRVAAGLLAGGLPGAALGAAMARSTRLRGVVGPFVALAYPLPKTALLPFVILLLGVDEAAKVAVTGAGAFFLLLLGAQHGVSRLPPSYLETAALYRREGWELWRRVLLPGALPALLHGARLATGAAFTLIVAAEFLGARRGLGARIWLSWETFRVERMLAALGALALLGWACDWAWRLAEKRLTPWTEDR